MSTLNFILTTQVCIVNFKAETLKIEFPIDSATSSESSTFLRKYCP